MIYLQRKMKGKEYLPRIENKRIPLMRTVNLITCHQATYI